MLWLDAKPLTNELVAAGWRTPDTYANDYGKPGDFPAVYLFALFDRSGESTERYSKCLVAYVGMSTRLKRRWDTHNILPELEESEHWPMRWFRRMDRAALRETERALIHRFNPPWNIVGRRRGVVLT